MKFDFHMHSNASDGSLSPVDLLRLCAANGLERVSITDHDTLAAYERYEQGAIDIPNVVPGIELSTTWSSRGIHIVGLAVDPDNKVLGDGIQRQQQARNARAATIAKRLTRAGLQTSLDDVASIAAGAVIGRPHFAQYLVQTGKVKNTASAFRRYLGNGKLGDVRTGWASMSDVIRWIHAAGGVAVLAHPLKYRMTWTKLAALIADFQSAGGDALEVVCGNQQPADTRRVADLCTRFGLLASAGSDFHHPDNRWSAPGKFSELPSDIKPVLTP